MLKGNADRSSSFPKKKIHIDLTPDIHQKLRVKVAIEDVSLQAFVENLVREAVKDVNVPELKNQS